ncbi:Na/Pi cotransporter family protein [Pseudomonas coleopterorum]|uniref:Na/Pi cotransporter family protein n=1 Tax=Pseudomonas coleopterorum TaxID=1605838 RepID=UPI00177FDD86|nr:Na/Pi symporter [Pseudomonas coleopterorum]MBD8480502.1 Na/Pi cotransporter family protein [Pseudomonas coleopterorum]
MEIDIFKDLLVPVIGGLGIFMLGLEFMSDGINNLAANRMRAWLAKLAGTPAKGLAAGTVITGVLQSSTAMTVMTVGLVNAGVVGLRPAISVIMGANIGTTLGNGLIAMPLGPLGLIFAGLFALVYVFSKNEKTRHLAIAIIGFSLIFYGLNLLTGGLKPLRDLPEVMSVISGLRADSYTGLAICVLTAAGITAMIHSSSATIGIVMGLGAAGILDWQTAVAFSLGADLGTTVTSWLASLNLSKNAKRAAYAHIAFNFIGVAVMFPLFFVSMDILQGTMGLFGMDVTRTDTVDGKESFPMVPVAVGLYSIGFNIFNTALMFPFIGVFERVLSRIGASRSDAEDYAVPRHLDRAALANVNTGVAAVSQELTRYSQGMGLLLDAARGQSQALKNAAEHEHALDTLSQEIRGYTAQMFKNDVTARQTNLLASLIEEEDFSASLTRTLSQIARRIERQVFCANARKIVDAILDIVEPAVRKGPQGAYLPNAHARDLLALRERCLQPEQKLGWDERGAILALLGSAERALNLVQRIAEERLSVSRELDQTDPASAADHAPSGVLAKPL